MGIGRLAMDSPFGVMMASMIRDAIGWMKMKEACNVETFTGAFFREDVESFPIFQMEMSFVKDGHTQFEEYKALPIRHCAN